MPYWFVHVWKQHKFKIAVVASIITILVLSLYNDKEKGTYNTSYYYQPQDKPPIHIGPKFVSESKGEKECRRVLEKHFNRAFPKERPLFLLNNVTGRALEIDCCNLEIKVGVEYNGQQHYRYVKGMHKSFDDFRTQQYRDEIKKMLCEQNGFVLIVVPYTVEVEKIEEFILNELRQRRIKN
jgi:hypothetical protein